MRREEVVGREVVSVPSRLFWSALILIVGGLIVGGFVLKRSAADLSVARQTMEQQNVELKAARAALVKASSIETLILKDPSKFEELARWFLTYRCQFWKGEAGSCKSLIQGFDEHR